MGTLPDNDDDDEEAPHGMSINNKEEASDKTEQLRVQVFSLFHSFLITKLCHCFPCMLSHFLPACLSLCLTCVEMVCITF